MGCCLIAALLIGAPRLGLFVWWFADPGRIAAAFPAWSLGANLAVPAWAVPLAGFFILPWTTIAYVFVSPGGLTTIDWAILVVALLIDLGAHGGGRTAYYRRRRSSD
jgi:hypothetical protein